MKKFWQIAAPLVLLLGTAACGDVETGAPREVYDKEEADLTRDRKRSTIGDLTAANRITRGEQGGVLLVNKHLWRATLDTLSFMPAGSTDPFSGVISTDWSTSPDAPNERIKVAAFVTGLELEARSLKVAVYREVRAETGAWVSAPVSAAAPRRLEDLILTRARQMRIDALQDEQG
ncbi:DUF3576 domain-containing protein [Rhodovulum sp. DZ06]|uniref:DUF3576 domain-containing protein n=1 Tax=Rhodovulum sp. DZ06 TaxID=3425126 RepID=UPI003D325E1B